MKATHQSSVALTLATLLAFAAHGNTINAEPIDTPIDALKRLYLLCERASTNGTLNAGGAAYCSIVYEELKRRAFGDNFEKLSAWARAQQSPQNAGRR